MEFKYLKEEINNLEWLEKNQALSPYGFGKMEEYKLALSICEVSREFKEKYKTDFDEFIKVKCKPYGILEFIYKQNVYGLGSLHRLWKEKYKVKP